MQQGLGWGLGLGPAHRLLCYWLSLKCSLTVSLPPFLSFSGARTLAPPFLFHSPPPPLLPSFFSICLSHWRREAWGSVFSGWEGECRVGQIHGMSLVRWSWGIASPLQLSSHTLLHAGKGKLAGGYKGVPLSNSTKQCYPCQHKPYQ